MNVVAATAQTIETFANIFLGMEDAYMRERGADIKDIGDHLMRNMLGMNPRGLSHISARLSWWLMIWHHAASLIKR